MTPALKIALQAIVVLLILGGGGAIAYRIANSAEAPPKPNRPPSQREVQVSNPQTADVSLDIPLQGRLVAFEKVPIIAEVTGVFTASAHPFKVGVNYRKGELLVRIDDQEARYQLLAQKSALAKTLAQLMPELKIDYSASFPAWDQYLRQFNPEAPLPELPPVADEQSRYFLNARDVYNQYYTIKAAEERLSKYRLAAPFSGTLTEASATVGALVRSGQPLGTLTADHYELAASVPVADLSFLPIGSKASLQGPDGENFRGRVNRISTQIDPGTQTATVYLDVEGKGLREGLYLEGTVAGAQLDKVLSIDQSLLVGSDEIYIVRDSSLQRKRIEVVRRAGERVYVRGVDSNEQLLIEAVPGAYPGMRVKPKPQT